MHVYAPVDRIEGRGLSALEELTGEGLREEDKGRTNT